MVNSEAVNGERCLAACPGFRGWFSPSVTSKTVFPRFSSWAPHSLARLLAYWPACSLLASCFRLLGVFLLCGVSLSRSAWLPLRCSLGRMHIGFFFFGSSSLHSAYHFHTYFLSRFLFVTSIQYLHIILYFHSFCCCLCHHPSSRPCTYHFHIFPLHIHSFGFLSLSLHEIPPEIPS